MDNTCSASTYCNTFVIYRKCAIISSFGKGVYTC